VSVFEKILVPLDGSEHSLHALEKAVQIAKKFNGKITLIHVYYIRYGSFTLTSIQVDRYVQDIHKSGKAILADGEKKVKAEGVKVETILKEGHNVDEILKTARDGNFDLIVIGARGISKLKEILLGSVSHGVTNHATCPVLVVK
jgi:nucleotide-binding universal stress UspA family protein